MSWTTSGHQHEGEIGSIGCRQYKAGGKDTRQVHNLMVNQLLMPHPTSTGQRCSIPEGFNNCNLMSHTTGKHRAAMNTISKTTDHCCLDLRKASRLSHLSLTAVSPLSCCCTLLTSSRALLKPSLACSCLPSACINTTALKLPQITVTQPDSNKALKMSQCWA